MSIFTCTEKLKEKQSDFPSPVHLDLVLVHFQLSCLEVCRRDHDTESRTLQQAFFHITPEPFPYLGNALSALPLARFPGFLRTPLVRLL